eukprot:474116-Pyramimonas_sp.AAC.1
MVLLFPGGSHDPDVGVLNRAVPAPSTADVPIALQCLSYIKAKACVGDVESVFAQDSEIRGDRFFLPRPLRGAFLAEIPTKCSWLNCLRKFLDSSAAFQAGSETF